MQNLRRSGTLNKGNKIIFLYLLYTVNQFSITYFRYFVSTFSYKHMPQCKLSLYLKKAGLASRNIVHFLKKSFYVVLVFALIIIIYIC